MSQIVVPSLKGKKILTDRKLSSDRKVDLHFERIAQMKTKGEVDPILGRKFCYISNEYFLVDEQINTLY